jgi:hypothetical protein
VVVNPLKKFRELNRQDAKSRQEAAEWEKGLRIDFPGLSLILFFLSATLAS